MEIAGSEKTGQISRSADQLIYYKLAGVVQGIDGSHAGFFDLSAWQWCRRYPQPSQYSPHRRGADADTQAKQFARDPLVAQPGFSRAICSISTASLASIGGRPRRWC